MLLLILDCDLCLVMLRCQLSIGQCCAADPSALLFFGPPRVQSNGLKGARVGPNRPSPQSQHHLPPKGVMEVASVVGLRARLLVIGKPFHWTPLTLANKRSQ